MQKTNEVIFTLLLIVTGFFTSIFYVCPIVKSIWDMLVFPSTNTHLTTGVILFGITMKSLVMYKRTTEPVSFFENSSNFISFQLTVGFIWGIAKLYTYFI